MKVNYLRMKKVEIKIMGRKVKNLNYLGTNLTFRIYFDM